MDASDEITSDENFHQGIKNRKVLPKDFEYAVRLDSPLVSLFCFNGKNWKFVRNAKRWDGITICQLEHVCGDDELLVFPLGMIPDQVWDLLHKLENTLLPSD